MITWTQLYSQTHQFNEGAIAIAPSFVGNVLAIAATTKPEYAESKQIIGYVFQDSGEARKGYALYSGKDILLLAVPETTGLTFFPTNYLSDSYTLDISYASIGNILESNTAPIPDVILELPVKVLEIENSIDGLGLAIETQTEIDLSHASRLTALEGIISNPSWGDISDKPSTFPPSEHAHAISDVTGLEGDLLGINTELESLSGRVDTLEASPSSGASVNKSTETSLALDATLTVTAKEILKVYKKVPLLGTNLVPTMTSNTAPSPLVASSNGSANGSAFNAFDKVLTDRGWLADSQTGRYVQIDMGTAITADTLSCLVRSASIPALEYAKKLTLVTSDDGSAWSSPLVAETNWNPIGDVFTDFFFVATTARYWRLFCEDRSGGYPAVNEMKLSLSTGYQYDDVTKDFTISRDEMDVTDASSFTLTKRSTGVDTVVVTYL